MEVVMKTFWFRTFAFVFGCCFGMAFLILSEHRIIADQSIDDFYCPEPKCTELKEYENAPDCKDVGGSCKFDQSAGTVLYCDSALTETCTKITQIVLNWCDGYCVKSSKLGCISQKYTKCKK
jgi:hypothetical protein